MGKPTICKCENKDADQLCGNREAAQISFAVTAKLISVFVFATRIVHFLFFLNPKFQASSLLLKLYRPVCVRPVRKPHCWFSHEAAQCSYKPTVMLPLYSIVVNVHTSRSTWICLISLSNLIQISNAFIKGLNLSRKLL